MVQTEEALVAQKKGERLMATWRELITDEMAKHGETWDDILIQQFFKGDADTEFDDGYGGSEGSPFTVWTTDRVYFPVVYDGAEWVRSVSRHPDGESMKHVGGE